MSQSNVTPPTSQSSSSSSSSKQPDDAVSNLQSSVAADAQNLGKEAKNAIQEVAGQARESAQSKLSSSKDRAAESLGTVADALRHTGQHLRLQDQPTIPQYIDRVAERMEAASGYLRDKELSAVLGDVESFARREPALFFGGAFALGLLGGRFLKSSRPSQRSGPAGGAEAVANLDLSDTLEVSASSARSRSGQGRGRRQPGPERTGPAAGGGNSGIAGGAINGGYRGPSATDASKPNGGVVAESPTEAE